MQLLPTYTYSIAMKVSFWLLWLLGLGIALLFIFFLLITATDSPLIAAWNLGVIITEISLLFKTMRHFLRHDKPASELMLWLAATVFLVPLVAFGGCGLMSSSLRLAG